MFLRRLGLGILSFFAWKGYFFFLEERMHLYLTYMGIVVIELNSNLLRRWDHSKISLLVGLFISQWEKRMQDVCIFLVL